MTPTAPAPPPAWNWTPHHTPALARAILGHPATSHLPPHAVTDLIHTAGHDLAHHTYPASPTTEEATEEATAQILDEIAHGPYQYLNHHTTNPH
ncbi:hypothetical protein [Sinomonas humi]|uniref:Uncharacterized protein n=1 Tax=Sinomonas humi TaxID=1338436 RepID=A0A0B2AEW6_9MICC|nr:hypothetical protein [Sinomonas humi]KHL00276.1 hypothetical protein LK10_20630 [Sinomonas humi]